MSKANKLQIKGTELFIGWAHGGRESAELIEWNGLGDTAKLLEILDFVETRAEAIIDTLEDDAGSNNAKVLALDILRSCDKVRRGDGSIIDIMQLGSKIQQVATESAVYTALTFNVKLKARSVKAGKNSGKVRSDAASERRAEVVKQWHALKDKDERDRVKIIEARLKGTKFERDERTIRRDLKIAGIRG